MGDPKRIRQARRPLMETGEDLDDDCACSKSMGFNGAVQRRG